MTAEIDELKQKMRVALRSERVEKVKRPGPSFHRPGTVNFPPIGRGTKVTAFGSCFAVNITKHLAKIGFNTSKERDPDIYISHLGDGMVNVQALAGQFEWALENKQPAENLWHGFDTTEYGFDEETRLRTRAVFLDTEFFIITLGLSEVWYDEPTGGVFWRAVPAKKFDPSRHKFRVNSFAESKAQIETMYRLIRKHVPDAKVLFTLSPIPLGATFRPVSCVTANSVSKAILRAALDEFVRENEADLNTLLFYFPSYEFVNECFPARFRTDNRHPHDAVLQTIMRTFEATFCDTEFSLADAEKMFAEVRAFSLQMLGATATEAETGEAQPRHQKAAKEPKLAKPPKAPPPKRSLLRRALSAAKRRIILRPR